MAQKKKIMNRRAWLLLAIGDYIEPIQLQKTMFKFAMEAGAQQGERYEFKPYNWGPLAPRIYDDLAVLRSHGLVEAVPAGIGWSAYKLTAKGAAKAEELRKTARPKLLTTLEEKRDWVTSRSFRRLLTDVYRQYPAYARKSLFKKQ